MTATENVHATGVVLGDVGLLLRGPSGAGKSLLALELMDEWEARGLKAMLVSDDRVDLVADGKGLAMVAPRAIEGLIELRGRGIVKRPFAKTARLLLVVDLVDELDRMIEEDALTVELLGVAVARCPVPKAGIVDCRHQVMLIREGLRSLMPPGRAARQKTT